MHDRDEDISWMLTAADVIHELVRLAMVSVFMIFVFVVCALIYDAQKPTEQMAIVTEAVR